MPKLKKSYATFGGIFKQYVLALIFHLATSKSSSSDWFNDIYRNTTLDSFEAASNMS